MQVVCIIGSPKNNGSTSYVVDKLIEGMKENDIEVKRYCLGDMNINFCCGCKKCYKKGGKCVQKDDMDLIMKDVIESDIVVIASPSYWGDITGQLKVFFDRNTPYGDTNENRQVIPSGKKGIAIAIRAGKTDRENIHILESIEHYFGHLGITPISRLSIKETDTLEDLLRNHKKEIDEAYEIGKNIKKFNYVSELMLINKKTRRYKMVEDINLFVSIKLNEFINANQIKIEDIADKTGYNKQYIRKVLNYKNNQEKKIKIWFNFMVFFSNAYNIKIDEFLP